MKRLLLFLLCQGSIDGYSQELPRSEYTLEVKEYQLVPAQPPYGATGKAIDPNLLATRTDTTCEWMHISTRPKGFVISQMAKAVQVNGICVKHLDGHGKPFPVHYRVGWCEGRERVFNKIVELLNERR